MADENDDAGKKGDGAAIVYVESVNGLPGPAPILKAPDVGAYTTSQSDTKFTVPIASATTLGKVRVGAGLTIDAQGVLGTTSAAPDWNAIVNKPNEFPPNKAGLTTLGGIKVGTGLSIAGDGTLSATATAPDWSQITGKPAEYPPSKASATKIGGVKQGAGIFIDPDTGTINATGSAPTWNSIEDKPVVFPPPIASSDVLGGVKEGLNIEIQTDGTISATATWDNIIGKPAEFPPIPATKTVRGGLFVGEGLEDDGNGVVSVKLATRTDIGGVIPGDTLMTDAISGRLDVVPASKENVGCVKIGDTLYIDDNGYLEANPGAIQPATADTLGGIKVGDNLTITEDGVLAGNPVFFTNRLVLTAKGNDNNLTGEWKLPDGCKYFRVTVIGSGGSGARAHDSADKGPGGGGGGGGGWAQTVFFGDKFSPGTVFEYQAAKASYFEVYPDYGSPSYFRKKGASTNYLNGGGGQQGQSGMADEAIKNGYAMGGYGGSGDQSAYDSTLMLPLIKGNGAQGTAGFSCQMANSKWKSVAGAGGASMFGGGGGNYAYNTYGAGAGAGGDTNRGFIAGNGGTQGAVIIEW